MIPEKLGAFYLGTELDPATREPRQPLFYDARDLTTHAVCVGMTGSGKTGLCIALIEEALLDGVPVIAIDPKGDLGNLMLTFPRLAPGDFEPWVDPAAAERDGITVGALAERTAAAWREGLEKSGQDADRIARLRAAGEVAIYTPGSDAGLPLSVLRSFRAPPAALRADGEAWRDRVEGAATALLALIGVAGDPLRSREHVLLSTLLDQAWQAGEDIELAALIQRVVKPPLAQVGAFDLETFFPATERTKFALELNTLVASPSFAAWAAGEPLEIPRLLFTPEGKPRVAVLSIAHLGDAERMFFVTLLLQEVVSWMRGQAGTSSLRAILFMDEVAGYLPPSAMPPAKKPMLTLLKQARAFGLGVVLATQNPVDLDYKALSNAGTWWLGRLQTERDQARVLDGLEGASVAAGKAFDRKAMETTLAGLTSRMFVMNNVHDDHPVLFTSRFAMSYLAGPLTRAQIQRLAGPVRAPDPVAPRAVGAVSSTRPVVPGGLAERFIAGGDPLAPSLLGVVKAHHARAGVDVWRELAVVAPLRPDSAGDFWEGAAIVDRASIAAARDTPPAGARFAPLPRALDARSAGKLDEGLVAWVQREGALRIESVKSLGLTSAPGESAADFRARVAIAAREARDAAIDALREKFRPRLAAIASKQRTAEERIAREQAQASAATTDSAITIGASVLGALLGSRRGRAGSVASAARSVSRSAAQRGDVARARSAADELAGDRAALEADLAAEVAELQRTPDPSPDTLEVRPTKGDTAVVELAILWR